ncbi:lysozyme [Sphingomonas phage Eidolon]|uniref:Lysozyme n=1 Tax=Sphingomonas phage Eidolon TaxID=2686311 RepID=A0A6M3T8C8_9CAUD|nr:lysozyme [Sphingomonas phage Eidolon]QJD54440.1 lysozyme [Sphingomonas phage Eidolon]
MADTTFKPSLSLTLAHEGGFVNHPKDPGGATNKGVTQAVYNAYRRNKGQPERSVREITTAELTDIYKNQYWLVAGCNLLPAGLDYAVFDYAVNSGPGRAVKDLQRTINSVGNQLGLTVKVGVDSDFGQATLDAANACMNIDEVAFIESYCNRRMDFFHSLKTFSTFGKGWTRRVLGDKPNKHADEGDNGVIDYAVAMAKNDLAFPIKPKDLPTAIGDKKGEVAAKAPEADKAVSKTPEGVGAIAAGFGVTGATALQAADAVKAHIDDTTVGRIAAIVFGLLMLAGVGLVVYTFWQKRREQSAK